MCVMENYLTILLLSGLVLLSAFYGYNVEQRIVQIKKEFINAEIHHKNEMKKVNKEMKSISNQVKGHLNEMIEKESAYRKEIDQTNEIVSKLHNETIKLLTETNNSYVNTLKDSKKECNKHNGISFSARLGTSIKDIKPWHTVIFDKVISNDGNSYNADTGVFTAPIAGTYYFTSTIFTRRGSTLELALKVNEQTAMFMYTCASSIIGNTATNSIIVKLKKENKVKLVKHDIWGVHPFFIHHDGSTFSGFLL
ncbi:heavy metal-binding protein HIP-like [Mytilus trossulus]|uniref:heavy metal-binding protein HIP-like n=1 Tax=Mytilus trossulus TaxID=6551 RepID=UPI003006BC4B